MASTKTAISKCSPTSHLTYMESSKIIFEVINTCVDINEKGEEETINFSEKIVYLRDNVPFIAKVNYMMTYQIISSLH